VPEQNLAKVPPGVEAATLTNQGGAFLEHDLSFEVIQPTILNVVNRDDRGYQLQVVPNLVDPKAIAASATTHLDLTDPDAGTDEMQLLAADGGQVVARLSVDVETPQGDS